METKPRSSSFQILFTIILIAAAILFGCKKDDNPATVHSVLSENEVANLIAASLGGSTSTNGLSAQLEEAATVAAGGNLGNQVAGSKVQIPGFDTTIVKSDTIGSYSYKYTIHYSYNFLNLGNRLDFFYAMKGFYDTPRISSDDSAAASLVVTHIVDADTQYTINATYNRLGSQASKVGDQLRFTSAISVTLVNIQVSKTTRRIQSGSGTIAVSGQVSKGRSFSFSAIVTFLGNQQATVVINGKTFNVNLITGIATSA